MHILVVNDDGPPSPHSSPYVHSLVRELQAAGHVVSICLPHTQRSWIGKAHMIGQTVKPVYYRPPQPDASSSSSDNPSSTFLPAGLSTEDADHPAHGTTHARPSRDAGVEEWVLVDGTPASCVQIGLFHYFHDRGPVDLVLSGPNYGRNTTAVFALSSGTLGGALEAAACRYKAVALSYAFFSRNHDPDVVAGASRHSVRVVEALVRQWPADGSVDLYSVNVPLLEGVEGAKTLFAPVLQNYWTPGTSAFEAVDDDNAEGAADRGEEEERIRQGEMAADNDTKAKKGHDHKHFKWAPQLGDVMKSTEQAPPHVDGNVIRAGNTWSVQGTPIFILCASTDTPPTDSVTPLKANFAHAAEHLHEQELKL